MKDLVNIKVVLNKVCHPIPYDYYNRLHGYVMSLVGDSSYGKLTNEFIYSNLVGGENTSEGITFNEEPYFYIRTSSDGVYNNLVGNIMGCGTLFFGLTLKGIAFEKVDTAKDVFYTLKQSPLLISKKYRDVNAIPYGEFGNVVTYLKENLGKKASEAGFQLDPKLQMKILGQFNCKDIYYKGHNKGRVFKIKIKADDDTKKFILLNGLGRSCGSGFGFIY